MKERALLERRGVVSRELDSAHFAVRTDEGEDVLAVVPASTRLNQPERPGARVHMVLNLNDTAPARILERKSIPARNVA